VSTLKTIALSLTTAATLTGGLLLSAGQGGASQPEWQTKKRTLAFLQAVEGENLAAVARFQHPDIVLTHPLTMSGSQEPDPVFTGRDEALGYLRGLFAGMSQIRFADTRVAVTDKGTVSFVEADGDFITADGRPYRNVYVMRFEWTPDGRILRADEYYNPIIACQVLESPACDRSATAG
jgi:ketosteroid isomerase-like protein